MLITFLIFLFFFEWQVFIYAQQDCKETSNSESVHVVYHYGMVLNFALQSTINLPYIILEKYI